MALFLLIVVILVAVAVYRMYREQQTRRDAPDKPETDSSSYSPDVVPAPSASPTHTISANSDVPAATVASQPNNASSEPATSTAPTTAASPTAGNRLFDSNTVVPINQYQTITEDDPAQPLVKLLNTNFLFIYYSTAPAETLLKSVDASLSGLDLAKARHGFGGVMIMQYGPAQIWWMLFNGPHGSALVFLPNGMEHPGDMLDLVGPGNEMNGLCPRVTGCTAKFAMGIQGECMEGAAANIDVNNIVAPWAVSGYDMTAEPFSDQFVNGWKTRVYPAELQRAFQSWEHPGSPVYIMHGIPGPDGNTYSVMAANYVDVIDGPALICTIGDISPEQLKSMFADAEPLGYRTYMMGDRLGAVCTPIDRHASAAEINTTAQKLVDTMAQHHAGYSATPPSTDKEPVDTSSVSSDASTPSADYSEALFNAVASMLSEGGFDPQLDKRNGRIHFEAILDDPFNLANTVFIGSQSLDLVSQPYVVFNGQPHSTEQIDIHDHAMVRRVQEFFSRTDFAQIRWEGMFGFDLDTGTVDASNSLYCGDSVPSQDILKENLYAPMRKWLHCGGPFLSVLRGEATPQEAARRGREAAAND